MERSPQFDAFYQEFAPGLFTNTTLIGNNTLGYYNCASSCSVSASNGQGVTMANMALQMKGAIS